MCFSIAEDRSIVLLTCSRVKNSSAKKMSPSSDECAIERRD